MTQCKAAIAWPLSIAAIGSSRKSTRTVSLMKRPALVPGASWRAAYRAVNESRSCLLIARNFSSGYLGILRAGLVAVPVNHKFPAETIKYILGDSQIALALTDDAQYSSVAAHVETLSFDALGQDGFHAMLDEGPHEPVSPGDEDIAMILYTSGSTGRPKGVPLTHAGHLWALRQRLKAGWPFSQHRLLVAAPLYHMNALCVSLFAMAGCASMVLMPQFDAKQYLKAIERFHCTWITSRAHDDRDVFSTTSGRCTNGFEQRQHRPHGVGSGVAEVDESSAHRLSGREHHEWIRHN